MFDDLNSGGWLFVMAALIFGLGIVRRMISAAEYKFTGNPNHQAHNLTKAKKTTMPKTRNEVIRRH